MTQEELAIELAISRKTLSLIERGSVIPKVDIAYKMSSILDVTIEILFYNDEYKALCLRKHGELFENIADLYFKVR